jgi:hypothetical protein
LSEVTSGGTGRSRSPGPTESDNLTPGTRSSGLVGQSRRLQRIGHARREPTPAAGRDPGAAPGAAGGKAGSTGRVTGTSRASARCSWSSRTESEPDLDGHGESPARSDRRADLPVGVDGRRSGPRRRRSAPRSWWPASRARPASPSPTLQCSAASACPTTCHRSTAGPRTWPPPWKMVSDAAGPGAALLGPCARMPLAVLRRLQGISRTAVGRWGAGAARTACVAEVARRSWGLYWMLGRWGVGALGAGEDVEPAPAAHGDLGRTGVGVWGQAVFLQRFPAVAGAVPLRAVDGQQQVHRCCAGEAVHGRRVGGVPGGGATDAPARWDGQVVLVAADAVSSSAGSGASSGASSRASAQASIRAHGSCGRRPANG